MRFMPSELNSRLLQLLTAPAPSLSKDQVEQIVAESYGITGSATALDSERDQNFHIKAPAGDEYVLKIASSLEPVEVTSFQTQALLHVAARNPRLPIPQVCRTTAGATETVFETEAKQRLTIRLLTYLPGIPLGKRASTIGLRVQLGDCLAKMGEALRDFSHPAARHDLLWDMTHAAALLELLECIPNQNHRMVVEPFIRRFEQEVQPRLPTLRWQVIHNDLNPSNVLVDERNPQTLTGIIDFGDLVSCPLIVDVAIATAYHLHHTPGPLEAAIDIVSAYDRVVPLEVREIDLLFDLIATRLASAVIITSWHSTIQPQNRDYILRNASTHCEMLARFSQMSGDDVRARFRAVCGSDRGRAVHSI